MFADPTLIDIAVKRPRTRGELAQINGVGAVKLEQFGAQVLRVVAEN